MTGRRKYSREFKTEAINMVLIQGLVQEEVARILSIPSGTLGNWIVRYKASAPKGKPGELTLTDLTLENNRLRKELSQAQLERDILKKATAYFAKESIQSTRS
jgi:transposase